MRFGRNGNTVNRRGFLALLGLAPAISACGKRADPIEAFVPLSDGRSIPVTIQGNADERVAAMLSANLAEAMKQQRADLQRNIGSIMNKQNQRYGA